MPTLRLYSVYGPWEDPRRLFPALIVHALSKHWPPLVAPHICRDFIFADDVSEAFLLAASVRTSDPGAIYNVGTGVQTTLGDLVRLAAEVMDIAVLPEWGGMEARTWDTNIWVANPAKIKRELGWCHRIDVQSGFALVRDWFMMHSEQQDYYRRQLGLLSKL